MIFFVDLKTKENTKWSYWSYYKLNKFDIVVIANIISNSWDVKYNQLKGNH